MDETGSPMIEIAGVSAGNSEGSTTCADRTSHA